MDGFDSNVGGANGNGGGNGNAAGGGGLTGGGTSNSRNSKNNQRQQRNSNPYELDSQGLVKLPPKTCFYCRRSCRKAPLLACDYCPLAFHQDCLDPPLTTPPTTLWMCPHHVENFIVSTLSLHSCCCPCMCVLIYMNVLF